MRHSIQQEQVDGINRHLTGTGRLAKRGQLCHDEIIIGTGANIPGCYTVILADDPVTGKPAWFLGSFRKVTPREVSRKHELCEIPVVHKSDNWNGMLQLLQKL